MQSYTYHVYLNNRMMMYTIGTVFYALRDGFGWEKGLYMAVNVGYSIGWGYPLDPDLTSEWFSTFYLFIGAGMGTYTLGCFLVICTKTSRQWVWVIMMSMYVCMYVFMYVFILLNLKSDTI